MLFRRSYLQYGCKAIEINFIFLPQSLQLAKVVLHHFWSAIRLDQNC